MRASAGTSTTRVSSPGRPLRQGPRRAVAGDEWLPSVDGLVERPSRASVSRRGRRLGSATILTAEALPRSTFVGVDHHEESIRRERRGPGRRGERPESPPRSATLRRTTGGRPERRLRRAARPGRPGGRVADARGHRPRVARSSRSSRRRGHPRGAPQQPRGADVLRGQPAARAPHSVRRTGSRSAPRRARRAWPRSSARPGLEGRRRHLDDGRPGVDARVIRPRPRRFPDGRRARAVPRWGRDGPRRCPARPGRFPALSGLRWRRWIGCTTYVGSTARPGLAPWTRDRRRG